MLVQYNLYWISCAGIKLQTLWSRSSASRADRHIPVNCQAGDTKATEAELNEARVAKINAAKE